jgi:hypothetical protein
MRSQILAQNQAAKSTSISIKPGDKSDSASGPGDKPAAASNSDSQSGSTEEPNLSLPTKSTAVSFAGFSTPTLIGSK